MMCCYGCGNIGKFEIVGRSSPNRGRFMCSRHYRQCPVKRKQWAERQTGMSHSNEARRNIGLTSRGRKPFNTGKTHLDDSRILAGPSHPHYGKIRSESHCVNLSKAHIGKILSIEHRKSISRGTTGSNNPRYKPDLDREECASYRYRVDRLTARNCREAGLKRSPGLHIDHKVPVSVCYDLKIPIEICAHIINLQLLPALENLSKLTKYDPADLKNLFALMENL